MATRIDQVDRAFALLIGINDYSAYDASAKKAPGTSDLPAGRNDVGAFYRMCRALGVPHANIRILTSPKLSPGDLGEPGEVLQASFGEATAAGIREGLGWLASQLAHAPGDPRPPVGLLTYSGHGDFVAGHLALCPSDVRQGAGPDLEGALGYPEIQSILRAAPGAEAALTVVLDCCHAGAAATPSGAKRRAGASLSGRTRPPTSELHQLGARMLMAAAPGQLAYQSVFDGNAHGALSWALNVVAEQWLVEAEGDADHYTITHGALRDRADALLSALGFAQRVVLHPPAVAPVLFFHRGAADAGDVEAKAPDRKRAGIQINPDWLPPDWGLGAGSPPDWLIFELTNAANAVIGQVLVVAREGTNAVSLGYEAGTEYWNVSTFSGAHRFAYKRAGQWSSTTSTSLGFPSLTAPVYRMAAQVTWSSEKGSAAGTLFQLRGSTKVFGLSATSTSPLTLSWVQGVPEGEGTTDYVVDGPTYDVVTTAPSGTEWYPLSGALASDTAMCWSPTTAPTVVTAGSSPIVKSFVRSGSTLYMAIQSLDGSSSPQLELWSSTNGFAWTAPSGGILAGATSPTLFVYGGTLRVCFLTSTGGIRWSSWNGSAWSTPTAVGSVSATTLGAAVIAGTPYVVYSYGTSVKYMSYGPSTSPTWSTPVSVTLPTGLTAWDSDAPVALASFTPAGGSAMAVLAVVSAKSARAGSLTSFASAQSVVPAAGGDVTRVALTPNGNGSALVLAMGTDAGTIGLATSTTGTSFTSSDEGIEIPSDAVALGSFSGGLVLLVCNGTSAPLVGPTWLYGRS